MKKNIVLLICMFVSLTGWCAVGDKFTRTTEDGITVLYTVTSEPPYTPGTVSVGSATDNSYIVCIDPAAEGIITIPNGVEKGGKGYYVTSVANHAFHNCSSITKVSLPSTITQIGNWSFYGCNSLTSINFPDNLTSIGKAAFEGCSSLTEIEFPNKLKTIMEGTFSRCSSLRTVSFNQVNRIEKGAFRECQELDSITFLKSMTIESQAFLNCSSLSAVSFLASQVIVLEADIFNGCSNLKYVYSHLTLLSGINYYTFSNIHPDATLFVDANMVSAYENSTYWNKYFKHIRKFPLHVGDEIVVNLLAGGDSIKVNAEVVNTNPMSLSIKSLTDYSQLENVNELVIPSSIIDYDNISFVFTTIGESSFKGTNLRSIILGEAVEVIEVDALKGCSMLESLFIASSVKEISKSIYNCENLKRVNVYWRNPSETNIDKDNFSDIPADAILYVPAGTKERYEALEPWNKFSQIIETSPISVGDISASNGSTTKLPILLKNTETIAGLQFKLTLPEGVSIVDNEIVTTDRTTGMTIMSRKDPNAENSYLFVMFSLEGNPITGNEGSVMDVKLDISSDVAVGKYDVKLDDIYMATSSFETLNPVASVSDLSVTDYIIGDVNGDGQITPQDASLILQIIAKKIKEDAEGISIKAVDVNDDGLITPQDASLILQYIAKKISW